MIVLSETTVGEDARPSLRERKKAETRRALRRVALDLVAERGYDHVTIEDIAAAADVSPRTFFNYFASKEAAVLGVDPERAANLRQRLVDLPDELSILDALRLAMVAESRELAESVADLGGDPASWVARIKSVHSDPHLRAAHASHMASVERNLAEAVAERRGTDVRSDPYSILIAATAMGAMRAVFAIWANLGGSVGIDTLADAAMRTLAAGFPEQNDLNDLAVEGKAKTTGRRSATGRRPSVVV